MAIYKVEMQKGGNMLELNTRFEQCSICKHEFTTIHAEVMPGVKIYACENCLEAAKHYFIWICMNCGRVYLRPKELVINRAANYELRMAYAIWEDMQIIQGIDMCIECDPEGIVNYMDAVRAEAEC